jgi:hypothetical protein
MSFLRRDTEPSQARVGGTSAQSKGEPGIAGDQPCAHPGCSNQNGVECVYVDRRGRECGYSWCPEHQLVFESQPYCRRHGGVMVAISADTIERIDPPDLDNRALSLCEWVANDIDQEVKAVLEEIKDGAPDAVVLTHPLHLLVLRTPPARTWARHWTLGDHTGTMRKVSVEVSEDADDVVVASVDGSPVAREVPPWISSRTTPISDEAVQKRRDDFRIKLVGSIVWAAKYAERPWAPVS